MPEAVDVGGARVIERTLTGVPLWLFPLHEEDARCAIVWDFEDRECRRYVKMHI